MKKILLILTLLLVLFCTACRDGEVYSSEQSDISPTESNSSVSTPSDKGGVEDTASGGNSADTTSGGTVSTVVDEIVINEPTSSVITAIDLETGSEVQITVSNPSQGTSTSSNASTAQSSSVAATSSQEASSDANSSSQGGATEESSSAVSSVDPNRDTMDGFTPWK